MKEKKKRKTRRNSDRYPALNPALNLKTRQELIDFDYIDKLTDKEKKWLNEFTEEYVNCSIDRENLRKNLHTKTIIRKKERDGANNARNRCILTRAKAQGLAISLTEMKKEYENEENKIIGILDGENEDYLLKKPIDLNETSDDSNED